MLKSMKIGHYTDETNGTGCTVIIPPAGTIASASVKGASPGTREIALLSPERKINSIHALLLTGGSAFGLNAAHGIVEQFEEQGIGYETSYGVVPIIPAAVIFDLNIGNGSIRPTPENAREALLNAEYDNRLTGSVGVGTGATVGKWSGIENAMKGGLGLAQNQHGKLKVMALTVVNSVGDVLDADGTIIAGARAEDGSFAALDDISKRWGEISVGMAESTVLNVIITNASISKQQAFYVAERAHYGIARRIEPSHTSFDGDISFILAAPEITCPIDLVAALAVRSTEEAIVNAVNSAKSLAGIPAWQDL